MKTGKHGEKEIKIRESLTIKNLIAITSGEGKNQNEITKIVRKGKELTKYMRLSEAGLEDGDRVDIAGQEMSITPKE